MPVKNKTTETTVSVEGFIESFVENEVQKKDSYQLLELMKQWSGQEPRMWGPSIIGFGSYHYKYASGHEGDAPLIGFSPRKAAFSLYVYMPGSSDVALLEKLGKYKMGKACIYVKKLEEVRLEVLEKMCRNTMDFLKGKYP